MGRGKEGLEKGGGKRGNHILDSFMTEAGVKEKIHNQRKRRDGEREIGGNLGVWEMEGEYR